MSVTVRNAWINNIPVVWVLERCLEVKTSREVEISQDAKEWHHASTTTSSVHHSFFASDLHQPTFWNGHGVDIESDHGDHAPIIPDYRTLNNLLALRTYH